MEKGCQEAGERMRDERRGKHGPSYKKDFSDEEIKVQQG